ncbi:chemotaxis protein CheA [Paenibacillus segetis]|uniref:Chemotaxis protein CheA n=1 Tax=Paenibacillus segetis TaxID=1325360 RepID=A0ABQ1YMH2_9BACL|nr:chemotaxis protein CheA [Paenibacillus segetis]GGH31577.1 chemotaxis protein CheA [Paenibacillus segetis]
MISEYREVFLEELEEQLQIMDGAILSLEQEGETDQVIQSLFRAAHTLKGSSAVMGYEEMKQLTHEMEHLLEQVRSKTLRITVALIDLLFKSMDSLRELKEDILRDDGAITDVSKRIRDLQNFSHLPQTWTLPVATEPISMPKLKLETELKVQNAEDQGLNVYWITLQLSADCTIKGARFYVIYSRISSWGEILHSVPDIDMAFEQSNEAHEFQFLFTGSHSSQRLEELVSTLTEVTSLMVEPLPPIDRESLSRRIEAETEVPEKVINEEQVQKGTSKSQTIRVSVERLDHLMNLVGELVIDHTRIHQVERTQRRRFSDDSVNELGQISDHLTRIIGDLQESVMKARMLPIEQLFNRFPRMVRDLSRDLDKDIELVIDGKDTELDRTLIEEISDPLIHLIRNAADHGIERPEQREMNGKNRKGTLTIRAAHEDNQIAIYVEDDGAGIDPAKMVKSALDKGIISAEEAMMLSDREAIDLIFRPGFSTASQVSDISGRGVGMDIVRSHIEKLNGLIDIETTLGQGTRFQIKLPLTLAIIVGLLVKLHDQTFIIPMNNITEIVRIPHHDIHTVRGQSVILLRDQIIPIIWLHDNFNIVRSEQRREYIQLVIVGSAEKRMALAVDELLGNQEIVIKALGSYIGKVDGIAGSTILGDGKVALILEVPEIINHLVRRTVM